MASLHDDLPDSSLPVTAPAEVHPAGGDANLDPLTHEPGAHPVGVGVGAMGVGAVGALLGAVAGPVGLLVGTVVGAIAGAAVGKQTAETVNPTEPSALAAAQEAEDAVATAPGPMALFPSQVEAYPGDVGTTLPPFAALVEEPTTETFLMPAASTPRLQRIDLGEPAPSAPPLEITTHPAYPEEDVRVAAYYRFLSRERSGEPGDELEDWATAERDILRG